MRLRSAVVHSTGTRMANIFLCSAPPSNQSVNTTICGFLEQLKAFTQLHKGKISLEAAIYINCPSRKRLNIEEVARNAVW